MKSDVTMRDIAAKLGISVVTVSKALNDKDGVGEELKRKIKETANEMGYRINALAKAMKEGYSYNIGVICAERFTSGVQPFYMQFYQYIAKSLEESHYSAILHILSATDEEELVFPRIYNEKKIDGFIILGQLSQKYLQAMHDEGIHIVCLDFYTDNPVLDCVITDNFYASYKLTNYLIKCGHRQIGFVGNLHTTSSIQDRFLGYYKSLLEHGLELKQEWIVKDRDELGKILEIVLPEQLPEAFVCNCDQIAYLVIQALNQRGVQVPLECSVVGFDNDLYSTISSPAITTVEVNMPEMAKAAANIIVQKVQGQTMQNSRLLINGKIVYRDSVLVKKG